MRAVRTEAVLIGAVLLLAACGGAQSERVKLSGRTENRPVSVAMFDKVELKGPDRVIVRVGGNPSVSMTGDVAVLDTVETVVEDGKLVVRRKGRGWSVSGAGERATITVTVPRLAAASVGGSGEMTVDRVSGGDFAAAIGGSGDLHVGDVRAGKLEAAIGGSGDLKFDRVEADKVEMAIGGSGSIDAAGRARSVEASIAGSGDVLASRLQADTAAVSIAGSGTANVHARTTAKIAIVGSGDAVVSGTARCETSKMGSGSVRCGGGGNGGGGGASGAGN